MAEEHSTQAANGARSESAKRVASSRPAAQSTAHSDSGSAVADAEFTARMNNLFATVLNDDGQEYSVSDVVRWINATGGWSSRERLTALRKGKASSRPTASESFDPCTSIRTSWPAPL